MEYNIGDKVKVKEWNEIPEELKVATTSGDPRLFSKGKAKLCGLVGTIVDKMYSEAYCTFLYRIHFDQKEVTSHTFFAEDIIKPLPSKEPVKYKYEIEESDSVVVAVLYEVRGNEKTLIERGHGHILHDGVTGYAQAASWALKKIYQKVNGDLPRIGYRFNRNEESEEE